MKRSAAPLPILKFMGDTDFEDELRRRVSGYFETKGKPRFATVGAYIKGLLILLTFLSTYVFLVFGANGLWEGIAGAVLLAGSGR